MTDQPTKGPFSNAQWTMIFDYMVRVDRLLDRAEFSGPNREANARRFMLMDELEDAANTLEANLMDNDELKLSMPSHVALRDLRDTLAKIKRGEDDCENRA